MSRPGLIIGLGGTGQWVATFVKKELMEINNEVMPSNVRILTFDTLPQATAETDRAGGNKEVRVGKVKLEKGIEFIHIGGDVYNMAEQASEDGLAHIRSWFQARYFIQTLPRSAFNLSAGAGAIRPLGRMGIFYDLSSPALSQLWARLTNAIQEVKSQVNDQQQLEIIIVSSLAGGTGSGMFLDVANLVRSAATRVLASNFIIRGMFVLPRAFSTNDHMMKARAFAAWRELDRFMINDPDMGKKVIDYSDDNDEFNLSWKQRIFDACYLLDPGRDVNPLTSLAPEDGIFPCVADIISAILDTTAGEMYTQWVTTNLAPIYAQNKDKSMHSSLGAYTIQVPIYYQVQEGSHRLATNFLEEWLRPERQAGKIVGLASNRNPSAPGGEGKSGANGAYDFLALPTFSRQGADTVTATNLPRKIYEVLNLDANRRPATQDTLVTAYASSGLGARGKATSSQWLLPFTTLGSDPQSKEIQQRIDEAVSVVLERKVAPPRAIKGETPAQTINRVIPKVEEFKREYVGTQTSSGEFIGGKFSKALAECETEHLRRFHLTLGLALTNILMPENVQGRTASVGTLGYAVDFAKGLVEYLNRFLQFMTAVEDKRVQMQPDNQLQMTAQQRQQQAQQGAHKRRFFGLIVDPKAYGNIESYMAAEQQLINVLRERLLHDAVEGTVTAMRDYADKVYQELNSWVVQLVTGDQAAGIHPLYETLAENQALLKAGREADDHVQKVRKNVADDAANNVDPTQLDEMLGRISWQINTAGDSFSSSVGIAPKLDKDGEVIAAGQQFANNSTRTREARTVNLNAVRNISETYFTRLRRERMVAPVLAESYTGDQLAQEMHGKADPLYKKIGRGPRSTSCYIRVHSKVGKSEVEGVFSDAEARLQALSTGIQVKMIESDDAYKCTMVRSDDCIESRHFAAWKECQDEYIHVINSAHEPVDPRILHIFPAEVNASYYERQLDKLEKEFRTFSPQVVMMLEDIKKARTFFMAYLLGLIEVKEADDSNQFWYELDLKDGSSPIRLTKPSDAHVGIFTLMNSFVNIGRDVRPAKNLRVQYEKVAKAVDLELARDRDMAARISWLEGQMKGEFHDQLIEEAKLDEEGGKGEYADPEYADLADLMDLMLLEQIEGLKSRKPRTVNR